LQKLLLVAPLNFVIILDRVRLIRTPLRRRTLTVRKSRKQHGKQNVSHRSSKCLNEFYQAAGNQNLHAGIKQSGV
jgi:hypothetical protein